MIEGLCPRCKEPLSEDAIDDKHGAKMYSIGQTFHIRCGEIDLREVEAELGNPSPSAEERIFERYKSLFGEKGAAHLREKRPEWFTIS